MKYISYTIISANTSRKELSWELRILLFFFLSLCLCVSPALLGRVKGLTQLLGKGFIWGSRPESCEFVIAAVVDSIAASGTHGPGKQDILRDVNSEGRQPQQQQTGEPSARQSGILVFGYYAMLVWPKPRAEWPIWHEAKTGQGSPAQPVAWPAVAC